tara:strand:- start:323 stop:1249 length:927 start_codon:yes stop_codon:yes gene_type:complete
LNDGGASGWFVVATQATNQRNTTIMDDTTIIEFSGRDAVIDPLTELLRKGARELLQAAIEAERDAFLAEFAERRTSDGRAAVVGSGYHPERAVQTGIGPVTVKVPKVRAKDGKPVTFRSALVPPYVRKAKSIEAALPWLYLKGISTGEMGAALKMLLGPEATGFSAKTISRLKGQWAAEYDDWRKADLSRDEWVYIWADGIYSGLRGSDDRLCVLVVIGVNARGEKHFLAIEDGVRESTQSWREVLLALKARGLAAPKLATGDGAMVLGRVGRGAPSHPPAALLDAQNRQRAQLPAQAHPAQSQEDAA